MDYFLIMINMITIITKKKILYALFKKKETQN